ncbi:MAG TPA: hypothetical protein VES19_13095 [Candidatus Limnocylindrales bacterium]|nr:hypothetical protein [Candidatus Limnocylindrales bacterium]
MSATKRDLLMEMREDIRGLKAAVDAIAKDQARGVERRASMQRSADSIYARLDGHDRDLDRMLAGRTAPTARSSSPAGRSARRSCRSWPSRSRSSPRSATP